MTEERKQLLNLVSKSHTEKKSKVWKPNEGNNYYCINYYGHVNDNVYTPTVGNECYKLGNCFKTREEAEFALEKQKLITEIKRYIAETTFVTKPFKQSAAAPYSFRLHERGKLYCPYCAADERRAANFFNLTSFG